MIVPQPHPLDNSPHPSTRTAHERWPLFCLCLMLLLGLLPFICWRGNYLSSIALAITTIVAGVALHGLSHNSAICQANAQLNHRYRVALLGTIPAAVLIGPAALVLWLLVTIGSVAAHPLAPLSLPSVTSALVRPTLVSAPQRAEQPAVQMVTTPDNGLSGAPPTLRNPPQPYVPSYRKTPYQPQYPRGPPQ